jgi:hypothetical protein
MLRKFRDQLAIASGDGAIKAPPFVIRASDLDKNFGLCYPMPVDGNNAAYTIERPSEDGFRLIGNKIFDVCENGQPVKYRFFAERLPDP